MNRAWTTVGALCVLAAPAPALACGGFFCSSAPIDQAGESIVYAIEDDGTLTMSIQIRYSGDDDDFAWILPVNAPPDITLGTEALFDRLHGATRPVFTISDVREGRCRPHPTCVEPETCAAVYDSGCGFSGGGGGGWTGGFVDAGTSTGIPDAAASVQDAAPPTGVTVFSQGAVGPYDTVVLGASTAQEVVDWLHENDYDVPLSSVPVLETYAAAGQVFVALRLSSNARTRMIRPITLRMRTDEVCLPIRLTAIATVPDMPITAYFLGREQVRAANYNTAMIDTTQTGLYDRRLRYEDLVSQRVDALGGRAFATDYAGPTPALSIELPSVDDLTSLADAGAYLRELSDRGYQGDAQLLDLLETYMPPPARWEDDPQGFYNCLFTGGGSGCGAPSSFEAEALTAQIALHITAPRRDAEALVHRHPYVTRLYTTMSAEDMTIDPVFVTEADLPNQPAVHTAERVTACSADYFREGAPQHYLIPGREGEVPIRSGVRADDRAYCGRFGAVPIGEAPSCEEMRESSGGCLSSVGGTAPIQGGLLFGLGLLLAVRRIRRR